MNDINKEIEKRVSTFVTDLTALVRQAAVDAVADVLGSSSGRVGRPRVAVVAVSAAKPSKAAASSDGGRRSPEQIATALASVLAYIKAHPNTRSEAVRKALNLSKPVAHDSLGRLRASKKIKMKGVKRAATYTVV